MIATGLGSCQRSSGRADGRFWPAAMAGEALCWLAPALLLACCATPTGPVPTEATVRVSGSQSIALPEPRVSGPLSVEAALRARRSVRHYAQRPLTLAEMGQLLWAAQGITGPRGERTAPSAGALYPLEVYVAASLVDGLEPGVYKYQPRAHALRQVAAGDRRLPLYRAALDQEAVREGAAVIGLAAVFGRTTVKYGERGVAYVHAEAGAAAQNVYLQATALGLGTVYIGAFRGEAVREALALAQEEEPLVLMPVGHR